MLLKHTGIEVWGFRVREGETDSGDRLKKAPAFLGLGLEARRSSSFKQNLHAHSHFLCNGARTFLSSRKHPH